MLASKSLVKAIFFALFLSTKAHAQWVFPADLFEVASPRFGGGSDHLSLQLKYSGAQKVLWQLESTLGRHLNNRGESHITLITPPEFTKLRSHLKIEDLRRIAESFANKLNDIKSICIGQGRAAGDSTYYVVVESSTLIEIRQAIAKEFRARGGSALAFDSKHFYPHITLGFTSRDLHEVDGVIKDVNSCSWL